VIRWLKTEVGRAPVAYACLLVVLAAAGAYANTLDAGFHFDDSHHIVANPFLRHARFAGEYFSRPELFSALGGHRMYRPLVLLSFHVNYSWGGYVPLVWRLTAIALHCICATGVFLTFRTVAGRLGLRPRASRDLGALVAALFFALHPAFTETVDYASARSSLLATLFVLWAFHLHHLAQSRGGLVRLALWTGSLALFAAGLLSKEIAIVFPALLIASAFLQKRGYAPVLPSVLVAALYLYVRQVLLGAAVVDFEARADAMALADPGSGGARPVLFNLYTQARVIAAYLGLFAYPTGFCVHRDVRVSQTPFEPGVIGGALLIAGLLWLAWRARKRNPCLSLGIVWFFVALAPTSSVIPLNQVMNEHRLYLPGVGLALAVGAALRRVLARPRPWVLPAGACAAALLVALTLERNEDWRDPVRLWRSAVEVSPTSDGAWNSLGVELRMRGRYEEALDAFRRAMRLDPHSWSAVFNQGTLYLQRARDDGDAADLERARRWLEKSLEVDPGSERSRWYLAETLFEMGRKDEAERAFLALAGLNARLFEMTRYPLARIALDRGDAAKAGAYFREALREGRDPVAGHLGLAELALDRGDGAEALAHANRAIAAREHDPRPHLFLAKLHRGTAVAAFHLFEAERRGYRPSSRERVDLLGRRAP